MSGSNRGIILAVGLILVTILAVGGAVWLIKDANRHQLAYEQQAEANAKGYADGADKAIIYACPRIPTKDQADCVREEREAAREGQRKEYDLQAQLVTSVWTRYMGIAAMIGMAVSVIGAGLVFITFHETRRTAEIAQGNLEAYHQAERGYVHVEGAILVAGLTPLYRHQVYFRITNPGRAMVKVTQVVGGFRADALAWQWDEAAQFTSIRHYFCKSGESVNIFGPAIPKNKQDSFVMMGAITYQTLGLPDRKSHFCFALNPDDSGNFHAIPMQQLTGMPEDT